MTAAFKLTYLGIGTAKRHAKSASRPRVDELLDHLRDKHKILVTTHRDPDPDALASAIGLSFLLHVLLPDSKITTSFAGELGGGLNSVFASYSLPLYASWSKVDLTSFDAVCLLDCQPSFTNSPLPPEVCPVAVIDHHPALRGKPCHSPFIDIRRKVGASCSIIYSYFSEMNLVIPKDIAALMLYGIESDLAGAAGQPGELDNAALSALTLIADMRKLYRIRFADLSRSYYQAYYQAMQNAVIYDHAMVSHLRTIDSPEQPAVMADFLLRYESVTWVMVSALSGRGLAISLRTTDEAPHSAGSTIAHILKGIGNGGGHPTKAGGYVPLKDLEEDTVERMQNTLKRRYLAALGIQGARPQRLISDDHL